MGFTGRWFFTLALLIALPIHGGSAGIPNTCGTCQGTGSEVRECPACEGSGKSACLQCGKPTQASSERRMWVIRRVDPEGPQQLQETLQNTVKLGNVIGQLGAAMGVKTVGRSPGRLPCPAICAGGVSFLNKGHPCKLCKQKGNLECPTCKGKGDFKCVLCKGKKRLPAACSECAGSGSGSVPVELDPVDLRTCPWCADAGLRDCLACDEQGRVQRVCGACGGAKKLACRTCRGTSRAPCKKCYSTGDLSSYFAAKKSNSCDACNRKGFLKCGDCKGGTVTCATCDGAGDGLLLCLYCYGHRQEPCAGCWDGVGQAWLVSSERLTTAGRLPEAASHLEFALEREEARAERLLEATPEEDRPKRRKKLDRELAALRARLDKLRKEL